MSTSQTHIQGFDHDRLTRIDRWMDRYVADRKFAGCSALVLRNGQVVHSVAKGLASVETDVPFARDTLARIYSMTKPITSVAIMMLAERGLIHLNMPVSELIPAFASMRALIPDATDIGQTQPCASPTLHQLLTHTSGLTYPFNTGVLAQEMDAQSLIFGPAQGPLAAKVDQLAALPLAFPPGKSWEYSVAIDVLGRVIEVVSGKTLAQFFKEDIFAPLGMTETGFSVPKGQEHRFASLYTPLSGDAMSVTAVKSDGDTLRLVEGPENSAYLDATLYSGGGGLVGSIDDYVKFAEMLRLGGKTKNGHLLSPSTVSYMMRNHLPGDIASMGPQSFAEQPMEGMGFGLGGAVVLDPALSRMLGNVGDFSWGGMASTFFWVDPSLDLSVVFFTQLSPSSSYPARAELKALVHGALLG